MAATETASEPRHGSQGWKLIDYECFETPNGPVGVFQYQRATGRFYLEHEFPRAETEDKIVERRQQPRFYDRLGSVEDQP